MALSALLSGVPGSLLDKGAEAFSDDALDKLLCDAAAWQDLVGLLGGDYDAEAGAAPSPASPASPFLPEQAPGAPDYDALFCGLLLDGDKKKKKADAAKAKALDEALRARRGATRSC